MKRFMLLLFALMSVSGLFATYHHPNAWINEFHYDNAGGDEGEALEIVIENVENYNLELLTIEFYNGSNGSVYKTMNLKDSIACHVEGPYSFYLVSYAGIQNGAPDGFSLFYENNLLQFISYEGELTATEGLANGLTSTDIGVAETGTTEVGMSLQLSGTGASYSDFTWGEPASSTYCGLNNGQQFAVTKLRSVTNDLARVFTRKGSIVVDNVNAKSVHLFDASGRSIKTMPLVQGENTITTHYKGLVLVRVDNKVFKLILR